MTSRLSKSTSKAMCLWIVGVLAAGCSVPQNDEAKSVSVSEQVTDVSWPQDEWEYSTLEAEGFDPDPVNLFIEDLVAEKYGRVDHFLLIRHGRIVAEKKIERDYAALGRDPW